MRPSLIALMLLAALAGPALAGPAPADPPPADPRDPPDPYIWLEAFSSPEAMAWVETHNAQSVRRLESDPRYAGNYETALSILGAKDRIPAPSFLRGAIYNFWQDGEHLRGVWRRASLAEYRKASPAWETVLDVDALNREEKRSYTVRGLDCRHSDQKRCLISLSDGGEDAVAQREFDLDAKGFVRDGFSLPRGKHRTAWENDDALLVATNLTPQELTTSGYPYVVRRLRRGQTLSEAREVFRGSPDDGGYGVIPMVFSDGQGRSLTVILRPLDTFKKEVYVVTDKGAVRLAVPAKSSVEALVAGRVIVALDEAWTVGSKRFPAGAVVAMPLAGVKASPGRLDPTLVWAPSQTQGLSQVAATRDRLIITSLDNVRGRAAIFTPTAKNGWTRRNLALPDNLSLGFAVTDDASERAFIQGSGFLTPDTLWLIDAARGRAEAVKSLPPKFDASDMVVEQFAATSSDGVKIPYFVARKKGARLDGTTPTLMNAYGGFQVARTPSYLGVDGKLWLERGGAFVLANIRGGGEFGPQWHEAGLGAKRQIIYDDFAAVARDLFARKITSPRRLGIEGGSNGGLLMGVEMTQHPDMWNAVVIAVPLLDMIRISKIAAGASWQGEYGDVYADPAIRDFWLARSPYHQLRKDGGYPEPFIWTTTRDDRVGPQHARKFAARMEELGLPFLFFENTEGGHGSGADVRQSARIQAMTMTYLMQKLMD